MYDNFLFRAKRTVYKWWCIVYKPVYKLIHSGEWPEEKEPDVKYAAPTKPSQSETLDAQALADAVLDTNRQSQHNIDDLVSEKKSNAKSKLQKKKPPNRNGWQPF